MAVHSMRVLPEYSSATKLIVRTIILRTSFGVCLVAPSHWPVQASPVTAAMFLAQRCFQALFQSSLGLSDILYFVLNCSAGSIPCAYRKLTMNRLGYMSSWCWLNTSTERHDNVAKIEWFTQDLTCSLPLNKRFSRFQNRQFEALQLTGWCAELGLRADMCNDHDTKQRWTH